MQMTLTYKEQHMPPQHTGRPRESFLSNYCNDLSKGPRGGSVIILQPHFLNLQTTEGKTKC